MCTCKGHSEQGLHQKEAYRYEGLRYKLYIMYLQTSESHHSHLGRPRLSKVDGNGGHFQVAIEDWLKEPQTYCQVYIAPSFLAPQGIHFMQMTLVSTGHPGQV